MNFKKWARLCISISAALFLFLYTYQWIHEFGHYFSAKYIYGLSPSFNYKFLGPLIYPTSTSYLAKRIIQILVTKSFGPLFTLIISGSFWHLFIKLFLNEVQKVSEKIKNDANKKKKFKICLWLVFLFLFIIKCASDILFIILYIVKLHF